MACDCIARVNEQLEQTDTNTKVKVPLLLRDNLSDMTTKAQIVTEKARRNVRKQPMAMFATYCPFCGIRYEDEKGVDLIARERLRQVQKEGWDEDHDDTHVDGELARAAACYLVPLRLVKDHPPLLWPESWDWEWWKPSPDNRIRDLEKAGALVAAEIDRLKRIKR